MLQRVVRSGLAGLLMLSCLGLLSSTMTARAVEPLDLAGEWETAFGDMTLTVKKLTASIYDVVGPYGVRGGRVLGAIRGRVLNGVWAQSEGSQKCNAKALDGSEYWGNAVFEFAEDGQTFTGLWTYCDGVPNRPWDGNRP